MTSAPYTLHCGDALSVLRTLPDASVQCVVTSPPYWGLRSYGTNPLVWGGETGDCRHEWTSAPRRTGGTGKQGKSSQRPGRQSVAAQERVRETGDFCRCCGAWRGELGAEPSVDLYVHNLVLVFREVRRVLRRDGCLWLNIGDSYCSNGGAGGAMASTGLGSASRARQPRPEAVDPERFARWRRDWGTLKLKDLCLVPARLALALQADGWYVRSEVIWSKKNGLPEPVKDRPTRSHEQVFLLTKNPRYFYDSEAIREENSSPEQAAHNLRYAKSYASYDTRRANLGKSSRKNSVGIHSRPSASGRNRRSVWSISTSGFRGAHFAVFPPALVEMCVLAGTPQAGVCATCGAPWRRIIERGEPDLERQRACGGDLNGEYHGQSRAGHEECRAQSPAALKSRILAGMHTRRTVGWEPSCACPPAPPVTATVLDPFTGSGTVGVVCRALNRRFVGIELNPEYVEMARQRIEQPLPPPSRPRSAKGPRSPQSSLPLE